MPIEKLHNSQFSNWPAQRTTRSQAKWILGPWKLLNWELCNFSMGMVSCVYPMMQWNEGTFLHWFWHWSWYNKLYVTQDMAWVVKIVSVICNLCLWYETMLLKDAHYIRAVLVTIVVILELLLPRNATKKLIEKSFKPIVTLQSAWLSGGKYWHSS